MANLPCAFYSDSAFAFRSAEFSTADWAGGMNVGASNAPGIGIASDQPGLSESLPNWTLLDQFGNARAAQISQSIGGPGFVDRSTTDWPSSGGQEGTLPGDVIRFLTNDTSGDGTVVFTGNASLLDLDDGWVSV